MILLQISTKCVYWINNFFLCRIMMLKLSFGPYLKSSLLPAAAAEHIETSTATTTRQAGAQGSDAAITGHSAQALLISKPLFVKLELQQLVLC